MTARPIAARFGALGDMVMFLCSIAALSRRWGTPVDVLTSGGWSAGILAHSPVVGDVYVLSGTRRRPLFLSRSKQRAVRWLAKRPDAPILIFERRNKIEDILRAAEVAPQRVVTMAGHPREIGEHQIDHELRFATGVFASRCPPVDPLPEERRPVLQRDRLDVEDLDAWLDRRGLTDRPLLLVQPGNKRTMSWLKPTRETNLKYWPPQAWGRVLDAALEDIPGAVALICGVPSEQKLAAAIAASARGSARAVADDLPLGRLFALCSRARAMISVDTGPAHAAAALGCPLLVLFGATDPRTFGPRGWGPRVFVSPAGEDAEYREPGHFEELRMTDLDPDRVIEGWRELHSNPGAG